MKSNIFKKLLIIILFFSEIHCGKLCFENKIVRIKQTQYSGTELKIDGYYVKNCELDSFMISFIFYQNGVFLTPNSFLMSGCYYYKYFDDVIITFNNNDTKENLFHYGLFNVSNDSLFFEGFKATINQCYQSYFITAKILNDSTFVVFKEERSKKPEEFTILSDTFHYVHVTEKPDSTNIFFQ